MVKLSKIVKSSPKSREEQLKKKHKLFERGHSCQNTFKKEREELDKQLMMLQINEQRTKIFSMKKIVTEQFHADMMKIQEKQKQLKERIISNVKKSIQKAMKGNEIINEQVRNFIKTSGLDPFEFSEFWDMVMNDFIEIYLKGLPQHILTQKILAEFWTEKLKEHQEKRKQKQIAKK